MPDYGSPGSSPAREALPPAPGVHRDARARVRRGHWPFTALVLVVSVVLRAGFMDREPLWVDEAESALNALGILERGYPVSEALGMPIFENMLIRPWPGHPEYEFRDVSYSDRGLAVYHGWLPLYAIAASFKAFGVEPPPRSTGWQIDIDLARFRRHTVAARAPSLLFGTVFVLLMGVAARHLAGRDAALAALVLAGLSVSLVETTFQARYYALTLALGAAGACTVWRLATRGAPRDYARHAAVLVLLFYTNLFALLNLLGATLVAVALAPDRRAAVRRLAVVAAAVSAAAAPWLWLTGYLQHLPHVPSGRMLVRLPDDLVQYMARRAHALALFTTGAAWLGLAWVRHGSALPARLRQPWQRHGRQYVLLFAWMGGATASYFLFSPAASVFPQRLSLALFVPGLLATSLILADAARTVSLRRSVWLAPAFAILYLSSSGHLHYGARDPFGFERVGWTFEMLNGLHLAADARVYASPSSNNVLAFYARKPIQSIAPVRKSFLDAYPGEIVYIEQQIDWEFAAPSADTIRRAARDIGASPTAAETEDLRRQLASRFARERTRARVATLVPPLEPLSPLAEAAMRYTRARAQRMVARHEELWRMWDYPFARGFPVRTGADWWQVFFYRLVDPVARGGSRMNAADRIRTGSAHFLPAAMRVIFYSPAAHDERWRDPTALGGRAGTR